ncbi:MAG: 3-phosphoglycerate dehydrogenase family protein [Oscillospiraceae bacterium]
MYKLKTLNKIAQAGLDVVTDNGILVNNEAADPDAIMVRSADMKSMELPKSLLCIARAGAGTNNIPIDVCTQQGIAVFNTPGANAEAVKELVICALLMASRDVVGGIEWVHSIKENGAEIPKMVEKGKSSFIGPEIAGKTLGVVGLGAIGAKIANTALDLGMKVYGYDPYLSVDAAWRLSSQVKHATDIDTIYQNCDYITLHVPYMKDTHHMINREAFAKMKDGVRIINLARAELVDDEALLEAIDSTKVARYVTDFPNAVTANAPNTIPMPHLGASTPESEEKCAIMAAQEAADYLLNGNIKNSVNLPAVTLERMGESRVCVIHKNVPRMLNSFLDLIGGENINVAHMVNAARGEVAYTIIDTDTPVSAGIADAIAAMGDVIRVRVL